MSDTYQQMLAAEADVGTQAAPAFAPADAADRSRNPLRPRKLSELVGQEQAKELVGAALRRARQRREPLPHMLLVGPAGTGKSTLAHVVATETGAQVYQLAAPVSHETLLQLREVMRDGDVMFIDEALALETLIPTPAGWTTVGELQIGDEIFGSDGRTTRVVDLKPIHSPDVRYLVEFRDGTHVVTDAGHKWLAAPRISSGTGYLAPRVVSTADMMAGREWRIPNPAPVELPDAELPMDPYLFGHWLGNGGSGQCYLHVRPSMAAPVLAHARRALPDARYLKSRVSAGSLLRLALSPHGHGGPWGSRPGAGRLMLEGTGAFTHKHVPGIYLRGSISQRLEFLRGLMDTEGHISDKGYAVFSNTNHSIVSSVAEILRSLGYMPTVKLAGDANGHAQCFKVSFRPTPDRNPFRYRDTEKVRPRTHGDQRRVVQIVPIAGGPVRCIEVDAPDHLFLAGAGMVPTHNCHMQAVMERRGKDSATSPETLYGILEDRVIPTATGVLPYPAITMIGGTTDEGMLSDAFLSRFPLRPRLVEYTLEELAEIARRNARTLGARLTDGAAPLLAVASRGVPREINNLVRNAIILTKSRSINTRAAREVLRVNGIEESDGLTPDMTAMLRFMFLTGRRQTADGTVHYQCSVNTIATGIGKSRDTKSIVLRIEPYLIRRGYLGITHGGRQLTELGVQRAEQLLNPAAAVPTYAQATPAMLALQALGV